MVYVRAPDAGAETNRTVIAKNVFRTVLTARGVHVYAKNTGGAADGTMISGNTFHGPLQPFR